MGRIGDISKVFGKVKQKGT